MAAVLNIVKSPYLNEISTGEFLMKFFVHWCWSWLRSSKTGMWPSFRIL